VRINGLATYIKLICLFLSKPKNKLPDKSTYVPKPDSVIATASRSGLSYHATLDHTFAHLYSTESIHLLVISPSFCSGMIGGMLGPLPRSFDL